MADSKKKLIEDIRFGITGIESLSLPEIVELMDYCLPADVWDICQNEINRVRAKNLEREG